VIALLVLLLAAASAPVIAQSSDRSGERMHDLQLLLNFSASEALMPGRPAPALAFTVLCLFNNRPPADQEPTMLCMTHMAHSSCMLCYVEAGRSGQQGSSCMHTCLWP